MIIDHVTAITPCPVYSVT